MFEFHISRSVRDAYGFDESFFVYDGRAVFADFRAARLFAHRLNTRRPRDRAVPAGDINALGLIDEYRHAVFHAYRKQKNPGVLRDALAALSAGFDPDVLDGTLRRFLHDFPPVAVYKGLVSIPEYLEATTLLPHRETTLEEMLMLRLTNLNPAALPLRELFDDEPLARETAYIQLLDGLRAFFDSQPGFGSENRNLFELLAAPAIASPHSLKGQLKYILAHWGPLLGGSLPRILGGLDFLREEEKPSFGGPGPALIPALGPGAQAASLAMFGAGDSGGLSGPSGPRPPDPEPERFSLDLDWMPNLVLLAKNAHVWLDQLSRKHGRLLRRLDEIPDAELDDLREAGITGLWLIGVWERSQASQRIKQLTGNPEAVASAYSLYDYAIAGDLGGEPALADLKNRAFRRGIRLASDMVPNHMGIDSRWVVEHPDWFIDLKEPPYPAYHFTGPDLSSDDRVAIRIEDRYYDRTDAAVVFQRQDKWTGDVRYVYHGNDGTSTPWNDTAQLDYLKPEVREAVIQTILHVARLFPVIRFDAAMTLARRHLQRLWYPEPGSGGAIPSRAEHALSREEFDAAVPVEFWREVVDRAAVEAPDTLLLAEAFWLMEGYFVRTLGMHRVYNSAFMNMLRDEDNAKYRKVIKDTLEFDPEVLKRYVNFMNNPDERTAIEQFGDGGKYFGVCTLLATLPGLPMVGHGQIEGFKEKYGMEYRRAYYDETPRLDLLERHRRKIFPLFHRRRLFAGVEHFLLYDFFRPEGTVDENVLAYSNGAGGERVLVVYHNAYAETRGWIRTSAAFAEKTNGGDGRRLVRKLLSEGLNVSGDPGTWVVFKDFVSGLELIRNSRDLAEKGLDLELKGYQCAVFEGFREVREDDRRLYSRIAAELGGRGIPDLERAAFDLWAGPVQAAFRELVHPGFFEWLMERRISKRGGTADPEALRQIEEKAGRLAAAAEGLRPEGWKSGPEGRQEYAGSVRSDFEAVLRLPAIAPRARKAGAKTLQEALGYLKSGSIESAPAGKIKRRSTAKPHASRLDSGIDPKTAWISLLFFAAVRSLDRLGGGRNAADLMDEWGLSGIVTETLNRAGFNENAQADIAGLVQALAGRPLDLDPAVSAEENARHLAEIFFGDPHYRAALRVHAFEGKDYFRQEAFDLLRWLIVAVAAADAAGEEKPGRASRTISRAFAVADALRKAERKSGFETARFLTELK